LRGKKKYYPSAGWQRCQWHFMKNLRDKLPKRYESEIVRDMRYVWDILDYEESKKRLEEISEKWYRRISSVGKFLLTSGLKFGKYYIFSTDTKRFVYSFQLPIVEHYLAKLQEC
ncbi:MAG: transposase, partial [Bacteroidales bacterium]